MDPRPRCGVTPGSGHANVTSARRATAGAARRRVHVSVAKLAPSESPRDSSYTHKGSGMSHAKSAWPAVHRPHHAPRSMADEWGVIRSTVRAERERVRHERLAGLRWRRTWIVRGQVLRRVQDGAPPGGGYVTFVIRMTPVLGWDGEILAVMPETDEVSGVRDLAGRRVGITDRSLPFPFLQMRVPSLQGGSVFRLVRRPFTDQEQVSRQIVFRSAHPRPVVDALVAGPNGARRVAQFLTKGLQPTEKLRRASGSTGLAKPSG